jgi:hypothetical protein
MVLRRLSAGLGRLKPADRVEKAVACQERDQGVARGPGGAAPLFHEISRAEGPSQQTTNNDGLSYRIRWLATNAPTYARTLM